MKFSIILIKSYLKREGKNRYMCNKLGYSNFVRDLKIQVKPTLYQNSALDNGWGQTLNNDIANKTKSDNIFL